MLRELGEYHRPRDLREALQLLQQPHTVPLAGGTELLGRTDAAIHAVVDLQDLGLDYIRDDQDGLRIGAMTRLQTLVADESVRETTDGLLTRGAWHAATVTQRLAATIGGTLAVAPSHHDLLPALLAVDALAVLQSLAGQSRVPLAALLENRAAYLRPDTLIVAIVVPPQPEGIYSMDERISRTPTDRAIVCVAVRAASNGVGLSDLRIAVGGTAGHAMRLKNIEREAYADRPFDAGEVEKLATGARFAVNPPSDQWASSEYRAEMLVVLLRRALHEVSEYFTDIPTTYFDKEA